MRLTKSDAHGKSAVDAICLRGVRDAMYLMTAHLARIETQREFTPPASDMPELAQLLGD